MVVIRKKDNCFGIYHILLKQWFAGFQFKGPDIIYQVPLSEEVIDRYSLGRHFIPKWAEEKYAVRFDTREKVEAQLLLLLKYYD